MIELTFEECQDCLTSGAAQIESSSKQRQVLMDASVALSKSVDTFLSTSIVDLQLSMERHEQTRRKLQATEDALLKSRLSLFDAARRTRLQVHTFAHRAHTTHIHHTHTCTRRAAYPTARHSGYLCALETALQSGRNRPKLEIWDAELTI